jgi:hypothetical protein
MERERLLHDIQTASSALLGPRPLAHSQELAEDLPVVRRHVGPRAWYQGLETASAPAQKPGRPSD